MARFYYGGQAVIEGVMMRGRHSVAVAVRAPSGGIVLHEEQLSPRIYARRLTQWPFVRGLIMLWDMLILGTRMMMFSANVSLQPLSGDASQARRADETSGPPVSASASVGSAARAPGAPAVAVKADAPSTITEAGPLAAGLGGAAVAGTLLFSLAFAIGLFFLAPLGVVGLARQWVGAGWLSLVVEGLVRLAILILYLYVIGRLAGVTRVFAYHGAEHKSINCYEAGAPLDVEHVRLASKVHTRCGTGFLLIVVVLSIFVFALVGHPALPLLVLSRVLLVPLIAAIAYELLRLGAAGYHFRVVRWLMAPSLALQGLTTREPDDGQIECAIVALQRVLRADGVSTLDRVA